MVNIYFSNLTTRKTLMEKNRSVQLNNAQENILSERCRHRPMVQFSIQHRFKKNLQNNKRTANTTRRIQTKRRSHKTNPKQLKKTFFS